MYSVYIYTMSICKLHLLDPWWYCLKVHEFSFVDHFRSQFVYFKKKIIWLKYVEIMQQESEKMNPIKPETAVISSPQTVFGFYHFQTIPIDSPGMVVP